MKSKQRRRFKKEQKKAQLRRLIGAVEAFYAFGQEMFDETPVAAAGGEEMTKGPGALMALQCAWNLTELPGENDENLELMACYLGSRLFGPETEEPWQGPEDRRRLPLIVPLTLFVEAKERLLKRTGHILWRIEAEFDDGGLVITEVELKEVDWFAAYLDDQREALGFAP